MATVKQETDSSLKSIEEFAEIENLKAWEFAGVKAENNWAAGRMITAEEFKKAVASWLKMPMHGGKEQV